MQTVINIGNADEAVCPHTDNFIFEFNNEYMTENRLVDTDRTLSTIPS